MQIFQDIIRKARHNAAIKREEQRIYDEAYQKEYQVAKEQALREQAKKDARANAKLDAQTTQPNNNSLFSEEWRNNGI